MAKCVIEMSKLDELILKETQLTSELSHVHKEIKDIKLAEIKEKYGVEIGSIVLSRGKEFKVTKIKPWSSLDPSLYGYLRKKDGTWGIREVYIRSGWELKKE